MKKSALLFLLIILLLYCAHPTPDIPKIKNEIQNILDQQKSSWNEGNIEGFMAYYWNSERFTFQSENTRLHGWQKLLERYKKSYSGENMGTLDFTDIVMNVMSNEFVYVLGRWKLILKDSTKEGLFTIIFQRMPEGWKIIHDHTS